MDYISWNSYKNAFSSGRKSALKGVIVVCLTCFVLGTMGGYGFFVLGRVDGAIFLGSFPKERGKHANTLMTSLSETNHLKVWMSSNEPKLMSKGQLFYNSYYICLCGATLMACES